MYRKHPHEGLSCGGMKQVLLACALHQVAAGKDHSINQHADV
jgi:hypothetical protein